MRTIKPGKAGVTSITADGEIELLFLCLWYKKSLSHQTVLVSGGGNPKFCVTAKNGANREKFIMGGRRVKRLPPC